MEKLNHRITIEDLKEQRELLSVKRNAYGDILFELDGGLTRQFTPKKEMETPEIERVRYLARGRLFSVLGLQNPNAVFHGTMRDIQRPATEERDHVSKSDLQELGQTLTTLTVNTGKDIKNTVTGKLNKTAPVTQETRAALYDVTERTVIRWDSGQGKLPEVYDQYANYDVMRLNAEKHLKTKKANRAARDYRKYKK